MVTYLKKCFQIIFCCRKTEAEKAPRKSRIFNAENVSSLSKSNKYVIRKKVEKKRKVAKLARNQKSKETEDKKRKESKSKDQKRKAVEMQKEKELNEKTFAENAFHTHRLNRGLFKISIGFSGLWLGYIYNIFHFDHIALNTSEVAESNESAMVHTASITLLSQIVEGLIDVYDHCNLIFQRPENNEKIIADYKSYIRTKNIYRVTFHALACFILLPYRSKFIQDNPWVNLDLNYGEDGHKSGHNFGPLVSIIASPLSDTFIFLLSLAATIYNPVELIKCDKDKEPRRGDPPLIGLGNALASQSFFAVQVWRLGGLTMSSNPAIKIPSTFFIRSCIVLNKYSTYLMYKNAMHVLTNAGNILYIKNKSLSTIANETYQGVYRAGANLLTQCCPDERPAQSLDQRLGQSSDQKARTNLTQMSQDSLSQSNSRQIVQQVHNKEDRTNQPSISQAQSSPNLVAIVPNHETNKPQTKNLLLSFDSKNDSKQRPAQITDQKPGLSSEQRQDQNSDKSSHQMPRTKPTQMSHDSSSQNNFLQNAEQAFNREGRDNQSSNSQIPSSLKLDLASIVPNPKTNKPQFTPLLSTINGGGSIGHVGKPAHRRRKDEEKKLKEDEQESISNIERKEKTEDRFLIHNKLRLKKIKQLKELYNQSSVKMREINDEVIRLKEFLQKISGLDVILKSSNGNKHQLTIVDVWNESSKKFKTISFELNHDREYTNRVLEDHLNLLVDCYLFGTDFNCSSMDEFITFAEEIELNKLKATHSHPGNHNCEDFFKNFTYVLFNRPKFQR